MGVAMTDNNDASRSSAHQTLLSQVSSSRGHGVLPFSTHFSAKVCLKSAMNIARGFHNLPLPPSSATTQSPHHLSPSLGLNNRSVSPQRVNQGYGPRMMPIFACCAMQSSYALVMLGYKAKDKGVKGTIGTGTEEDREDFAVQRLLRQLEDGLEMILSAMQNYTIAYEALGGMKGKL